MDGWIDQIDIRSMLLGRVGVGASGYAEYRNLLRGHAFAMSA